MAVMLWGFCYCFGFNVVFGFVVFPSSLPLRPLSASSVSLSVSLFLSAVGASALVTATFIFYVTFSCLYFLILSALPLFRIVSPALIGFTCVFTVLQLFSLHCPPYLNIIVKL